jgi:excisionase family DNA binding protein
VRSSSSPAAEATKPGASNRKHVAQAGDIRYFTIAEIAVRLRVSTRTVRRWIENGDLTAHRFGAAVRIAETDLRAFLAIHRTS